MKYSLLVVSVLFFIVSCKKKQQQQPQPPTRTVSGTFTFNTNGYNSKDGYTKECSLKNGYLLIGGNSNSDWSTNAQYGIEASIKMPTDNIAIGQYSTSMMVII